LRLRRCRPAVFGCRALERSVFARTDQPTTENARSAESSSCRRLLHPSRSNRVTPQNAQFQDSERPTGLATDAAGCQSSAWSRSTSGLRRSSRPRSTGGPRAFIDRPFCRKDVAGASPGRLRSRVISRHTGHRAVLHSTARWCATCGNRWFRGDQLTKWGRPTAIPSGPGVQQPLQHLLRRPEKGTERNEE
jgi:hypothetical protein